MHQVTFVCQGVAFVVDEAMKSILEQRPRREPAAEGTQRGEDVNVERADVPSYQEQSGGGIGDEAEQIIRFVRRESGQESPGIGESVFRFSAINGQ